MRTARQRTWLKLGVWPAGLSALLPVVVALFHLMPVMAAAPAAHPPSSHHEQAHHEPMHHGAHGEANAAAAVHNAEASLPADPSDGRAPHHNRPHCPLCFFLQGLHALPAPQAPALRLPSARAVMVERYEAPRRHIATVTTSQPRAPPLFPSA